MKILYVTKRPPSPSGVALYAATFAQVLRHLGDVEFADVPADTRDAQSLGAAVRGFRYGLYISDKVDLVHVELSGRGLYELYFALGVVLRTAHRRPVLVLTCHDTPSLVGDSGLFRGLDRKGLRRLAKVVTKVAGGPLEHLVARRADLVLALTGAGARDLSQSLRREVHSLPHVVGKPTPKAKEPTVLVPGYVGDGPAVASLVYVVAAAPITPRGRWTVVVGNCTTVVIEAASQAARVSGVELRFTGPLQEDELLASYARAAVVVRPHAGARSSNGLAASGPLNWACAHGCVCITDDDRAGSIELHDAGLLSRGPNIPDMLRSVLADWPSIAPRGDRVRRSIQQRAAVSVVATYYFEMLRDVGVDVPAVNGPQAGSE